MDNLTEKDAELLEHVRQHYKMTGFSMSLADGAEVMGLSRGGTIAAMFKRLEAAGEIEYSPNRTHFVPKDWRELAAGGLPVADMTVNVEMPSEGQLALMIDEISRAGLVVIPPEHEEQTARIAELEAQVAELNRKLKAKPKNTNEELARIRKLNAERQKRFKQKGRAKK